MLVLIKDSLDVNTDYSFHFVTESVYQPREHPTLITAVGLISQLCSYGMDICGWHAKLGKHST